MNAVIYARYSSDRQTEQSIEGQLRECYSYAERLGYTVINEYIDRGISATTDNRPEFQRMISDSSKKQFQIIIVWKLDRFARNRYDSAIYKNKLKKNGVKVVSVTESIGEGSESIIMEAMLEAMAEVYSKQLSENVRRGLHETALKANSTGGTIPLGYKTVDKKLVIDEKTAPIVKCIFTEYASGKSKSEIINTLNEKGHRTKRGQPFTINSLRSVLQNQKYIGMYHYNGLEIEDSCPALIDREVFDKAQEMLNKSKRAPGSRKAVVKYELQGKLFCGYCGSTMVGESGRSKNGNIYNYYSCSKRKKERACHKKNEKKDFLEWYIVEQTIDYVLIPSRIEYIAEKIVECYENEFNFSNITSLEKSLTKIDREIDECVETLLKTNAAAAIDKINDKLSLLEVRKADTEIELAKIRIAAKIKIKKEEIINWLQQFCKGDLLDEEFRKRIIDVFVNAIYLYDEKVVIYYNIKNGKQISYVEMIDSSDEMVESDCSDLVHNSSPKR